MQRNLGLLTSRDFPMLPQWSQKIILLNCDGTLLEIYLDHNFQTTGGFEL